MKLTPKRVAQAIGVSESSMKRWCDRGLIDFQKTAGGHRRISQASVIDFLRKSDHAIINPELIGLPEGTSRGSSSLAEAQARFLNAILNANELEASRTLVEQFLAGNTVATIGDVIIKSAFYEIGRRWNCGDLEIYQERQACEVSIRSLMLLRTYLKQPAETAPLAIGGAPAEDSYILPTTMVEMVFQEMGWRSRSLGARLPFGTLAAAAREHQPQVFWLSVTTMPSPEEFLNQFNSFRTTLNPQTFLVVGGQALVPELRQKMQFSAAGDNLTQLQTLAETLLANTRPTNRLPANQAAAPRITNY